MIDITKSEATSAMGALLAHVEAGEEIRITDNGQIIARLVPSSSDVVNESSSPAAAASASEPLTVESRLQALDEWQRDIESRADRYPPGFQLDVSRAAIADVRD